MEIHFKEKDGRKLIFSPYELSVAFESFLAINSEWQGSSRSIASVFNDFLLKEENELN